jgi:hypothetical protein
MGTNKRSFKLGKSLSWYLCILIIVVGGCARNVKFEVQGVPVPNYVSQASLPASHIQIQSAYIHYFGLEEGNEILNTREYLNPYAKAHVISRNHLHSLVLSVHVFNPKRMHYQFIFYQEISSTKRETHSSSLTTQSQVIYAGKLSRKEFDLTLSTTPGVTHRSWYAILDSSGSTIFEGKDITYKVKAH